MANFIFNDTHKSIKNSDLFLPISEGGLNLLDCKIHATSMNIADFKSLLQKKAEIPFYFYFSSYWIGKQLKIIFPFYNDKQNKKNINIGETPKYYSDIINYIQNYSNKITKCNYKTSNIRKILQKSFIQVPLIPNQKTKNIYNRNYPSINLTKTVKTNYYTVGTYLSGNTYFKLIHNSIPCKTNIKKWYRYNKTFDTTCNNCKTQPETTPHIFLCPIFQPVWNHFLPKLKEMITETTAKTEYFLFNQGTPCKTRTLLLFNIIHNIYKTYCNNLYENQPINTTETIINIETATKRQITTIIKYRGTRGLGKNLNKIYEEKTNQFILS